MVSSLIARCSEECPTKRPLRTEQSSYLKSPMSNIDGKAIEWSPWLDFNEANIIALGIPESPGVYKMHVSMKILYIGSGDNLKQSLLQTISDPCIGKATRFSYFVTKSADKVKEQLIKEYQETHGNKLPTCMDTNDKSIR